MKVVGNRRVDGFRWEDVRQLTVTSEALRGTDKLVPRGLYRFGTFEEAHQWMTETIDRTRAHHGRKTSLGSAVP